MVIRWHILIYSFGTERIPKDIIYIYIYVYIYIYIIPNIYRIKAYN